MLNFKQFKGYLGECIITFIYIIKGYKILHRRYKHKLAEIDIIAVKNNTIIFIEVKTRLGNYLLDQVVSYNQKQRIKTCAKLFIAKNYKIQSYNVRFDLAIVNLFKFNIYKNAW
ncbi:MAG: YraN family protein [Rickettsiales bacterium]